MEMFYEKGQLVWHKEREEVWHVIGRYRNEDCEEIQYHVTDPTHTAYRWYEQETLREVSEELPISVLMNFKPASVLDLDQLVETISEVSTMWNLPVSKDMSQPD